MKVNFIPILFLSFLLTTSGVLYAQEKESKEQFKAKISKSFVRNTDGNAYVHVQIRHKVEKQKIYLKDSKVELYLFEESPENLLQSEITNEEGKVVFELNNKFSAFDDTSSQYSFTIVLLENENYFRKTTQLNIQQASLNVSLIEEDSIHKIKAVLMVDSLGNFSPVADAEIKFYVKRTFSLLPFGGSYTYTDEQGEVLVDFPNDLPGDEDGKVEIVIKVLDHEEFGTLEQTKSVNWGKPLLNTLTFQDGKLWSSAKNAPVVLVVISCLIILGIWGTIGYLIYLLFTIRKIGKKHLKSINIT